jgi:HD-GYP domain-containing protein (c-di-GMP phosphodiesterase class II)
VQRLGLLLAQRIVPAEAGSREMAHGFLLHDIGKLAVPDAILNKPGRLDPDELAVMRQHPEAGAAILEGVPGLGRALGVVRHHHERWDGGGYPAGLRGEDIPLWARIFAVVDTLDAMTSERPYARRRSLAEALAEVRANAGTQFDPAVVHGLLAMDRSLIASTLGLRELVAVPEVPPRPLALARA